MLQRLTDEIKQAMRAKDKLRLQTLRSMLHDLRNAGIDKKGREGLDAEVSSPAEYLDQAEEIKVLQAAAKRRREAAEQYLAGGRPELAAKEDAELKILEEYLPATLGDVELRALVVAAIAELGADSMADMGRVMKEVQPKVAGRADGKVVSSLVRELLA